jgi:hypothetical protein
MVALPGHGASATPFSFLSNRVDIERNRSSALPSSLAHSYRCHGVSEIGEPLGQQVDFDVPSYEDDFAVWEVLQILRARKRGHWIESRRIKDTFLDCF